MSANVEDMEALLPLRFDETMPLARKIGYLVNNGEGIVVILRGMPGCGKTSFANELAYCVSRFRARFEICSSRDFLYDNRGVPLVDVQDEQEREAIKMSESRFQAAMLRGVDCIIIDDCNLGWQQPERYAQMAKEGGYLLERVEFDCGDLEEAIALQDRNNRNIPNDVLERALSAYFDNRFQDAVVVSSEDRDVFYQA